MYPSGCEPHTFGQLEIFPFSKWPPGENIFSKYYDYDECKHYVISPKCQND